jgi:hypothetical protein
MEKLMTKLNSYRPQILPNQSQSGQAAFAVTLVIMIVLSLIVLGYANNARNEQRRALDDQLNTTAFYAAESGVNDAFAVIKADIANNVDLVAQTNCVGPYSSTTTNALVSPGATVAYTCLLVNPTPPSLEFAPLDTGHGQVVPVFAADGSNIQIITISWQQDGLTTNTNFTGCPSSTVNTFPPRASWSPSCTAGVLQVDMVPASGWSSLSNLQTDTNTVFLEPMQSSGNLSGTPSQNSVSTSNTGIIIGVTCGADSGGKYDCTTDLVVAPENGYYMHIVPIYDNADVSITATNTSSNHVDLANAQALIDSTGKASDELKRIQEYISINPVDNNDAPVNALQSLNGICKTLITRPGVTTGIFDYCN